MILNTLWVLYEGQPEMIVAWDEKIVDGNLEGFNEDCKKSLASYEGAETTHRYINIAVDAAVIEKAFEDTYVEAEVLDYRDGVGGGSK